MTDRRGFLGQSTAAMMGLLLGPTGVVYRLPKPNSRAARQAPSLMPPMMAAETMRQWAKSALETAVSGGAQFADIRMANRHILTGMGGEDGADYGVDFSYGVRARIQGRWALAYGAEPTLEGVQRAARQAVGLARALQGPGEDHFHPALVVEGEWATPVEIDPMTVSLDDHSSALAALMNGVSGAAHGKVIAYSDTIKETRVVANSEGTMVTQHLMTFRPSVRVEDQMDVVWWKDIPITMPELVPASAGLEILTSPGVQEHIHRMLEAEAAYLRYPSASIDVGQYAAVYDGGTMAGLALDTLAPALQLDRVLGETANEQGTSFLAPLAQAMKVPAFSSELNVSTDRALPHLGAAKWDDEGVATDAFPLITNGQVVDWLGTRRTVGAVAGAGYAAALHGTAMAPLPTRAPIGLANYLTVAPEAAGPTQEDLLREMKHGVLILREPADMDQQMGSGFMCPVRLFRVENGKVTHWLRHGMVNFQTKSLWTDIVAVGGKETVQLGQRTAVVGQPLSTFCQLASAPAMLLKKVDVTLNRLW